MTNDISSFMIWFINQVLSIFGSVFSILDGISFLGTSLLKFLLTILIISSIINILLTISKTGSIRSGRVRDNSKDKKED